MGGLRVTVRVTTGPHLNTPKPPLFRNDAEYHSCIMLHHAVLVLLQPFDTFCTFLHLFAFVGIFCIFFYNWSFRNAYAYLKRMMEEQIVRYVLI